LEKEEALRRVTGLEEEAQVRKNKKNGYFGALQKLQ